MHRTSHHNRFGLIIRLLALPVFLAAAVGSAPQGPVYAAGATITVDTLHGGLVDDSGDGACSLGEAIVNANLDLGGPYDDCPLGSADDLINFSVSGTILLTQTLTTVDDPQNETTTIDGGGNITIDGNSSMEIITINSPAALTDLIIQNASDGFSGGAVYVTVDGDLTVEQVLFFGNSAGGTGGAILNDGSLTVNRSTFTSNSAAGGGGAIDSSGPALVANSTLYSNSSSGAAGGAITSTGGTFTLKSSTVSNTSSASGGAVHMIGGTFNVINSILANSSAGSDCSEFAGQSMTVIFSLVETDGCGLTDGVDFNIVGEDPMLGSLVNVPAYFLLHPLSPAIDAGGTIYAHGVLDQPGYARLVNIPWKADTGTDNATGTVIDMGAYEASINCPGGARLYVDADATGAALGTSWTDAFPDLQMALHTVDSCGTPTVVWVAEGVYKPAVYSSAPDRAVSFDIPPGTAVHGGFAGTETQLDQRDLATDLTILSGDIDSNDTNIDGNNVAEIYSQALLNNSYHVVTIDGTTTDADASTVLDGLTVTAAIANGGGNHSQGGGLWCKASTGVCGPLISHVTFSGNQAGYGGGVWLDGISNGTSSPTFVETTIVGNHASGNGGGMLNYSSGTGASSPTFTNVTIKNNSAGGSGGGMLNAASGGTSSPSLTNVTFDSNSAGSNGGGMWNFGYSTGGVSNPTLTNVTFFNNSASAGGAINNMVANTGSTHAELTNVILWGDSATSYPEVDNSGGATVSISYSVVAGGCALIPSSTCGPGNLSTDPMMAALADNGGFVETKELLPGSPAINAGDGASCPASDARNITRPQGAGCDIGAFERAITSLSDFNGDGISDPAKFEPGTGMASWRNSTTLLWDSADLGMDVSSYVRRSDFDGDGKADPAKFVSSANAVWFLKSSTSTWEGVYMGPGTFSIQDGSDFDGDGKTDPARFDSNTNALWYLESSTSTWQGVYMGPGTYQVLAGADFDKDGKTDPTLFYSTGGANALWYLESSTSTWQGVYMGPGTYEMVEASDFDGDGKTDPALFISGPNAVWFLESSSSTWQSVYMGPGTLESVAANDFDGDGKTDPAEFIPASSELWWFKSSTSTWDGLWMESGTYDVVN